jgi:hypothetical protein
MTESADVLLQNLQNRLSAYSGDEYKEQLTNMFENLSREDSSVMDFFEKLGTRLNKKETRYIAVNIGGNEPIYEITTAMVGVFSYIYYRARSRLANEEISPIEYTRFIETLYQLGIPLAINATGSTELHSKQKTLNDMYDAKENARKKLLDILEDNPDGDEIVAALELNRPIENPLDSIEIGDTMGNNFMRLVDDYLKYLNLYDNGLPYQIMINKLVMDKFKLVPGLNEGYTIVDTLIRKPHESKRQWNDRIDTICRDVSNIIAKKLGDDPIAAKMAVKSLSPGEIDIKGFLPDDVEITTHNRYVDGLLKNVNKVANPNGQNKE